MAACANMHLVSIAAVVAQQTGLLWQEQATWLNLGALFRKMQLF
jgi:hypothetical protein